MNEEEMFFYIKINGVFYGKEHWHKLVQDLIVKQDSNSREPRKLIIQVYLKEAERQLTKPSSPLGEVDIDYFLRSESRCFSYQSWKDDTNFSLIGSGSQEKEISLHKLLEDLSLPETLDEDNMYRCQKCKERVKAQIKMSIQKVPKILVIFFN